MLSQTPLLIPTNEDYYYQTLYKLIFADTQLLTRLIKFLDDYHTAHPKSFENLANILKDNLKKHDDLKYNVKTLLGLNDDTNSALSKYDIHLKKIANNPEFITLTIKIERYVLFQQNSPHKKTLNEVLNYFINRSFQFAQSQKGEWEAFWKQKQLQNTQLKLLENHFTSLIFSAILHLFNTVKNEHNIFKEKFLVYADDFIKYLQARNCNHMGEYFDDCIEGRLFLQPGMRFRPQPQRLFEDKDISTQFIKFIHEFNPVISKQNIKIIKDRIDNLFLNVIFNNVSWMFFWGDQENKMRKIKEKNLDEEIKAYIEKIKAKIGAAFIYALLCQADHISPVDPDKKIVLTFILTSYAKEPRDIERKYFLNLITNLEKTCLSFLGRDVMLERKTTQEMVIDLFNECLVVIKKYRFSGDAKKMQAIALHTLFSRLVEKNLLVPDKKNIVSQVIIKLIGELDIHLNLYNYNLLEKATEYFTKREQAAASASETASAKPGNSPSSRRSPRVSGVRHTLRKSAYEPRHDQSRQTEGDPQLKKSNSGDLRKSQVTQNLSIERSSKTSLGDQSASSFSSARISPRDFLSSASSSSSRASPRETVSRASPKETSSSVSSRTSSYESRMTNLPLFSPPSARTQEHVSPRKSPRENSSVVFSSLPNSPVSSPRQSTENMVQSEPTVRPGGVTFDFLQRIPSKYSHDLSNSKKNSALFSSEKPFTLDYSYVDHVDPAFIKKIKKAAAKVPGNIHICFNSEGSVINNDFKANQKITEDNKARAQGKKIFRYEFIVIKKEKNMGIYMLDFNPKNIFPGGGGTTFIGHKIKKNKNKESIFPDIAAIKFMHTRKYDADSFKIVEDNHRKKQRYIASCVNSLGEFILLSKYFPGFTLSNIMYAIEKKPDGSEINHGRRYIRPEKKISTLLGLLRAYIEFVFDDEAETEIVHRDIKPENFIVKDKTTVIIDIDEITQKDKLDDNFYGTNGYYSPKINPANNNEEKNNYSFEDDVYSLGIMMFELLSQNSLAKAITSKKNNAGPNAMMTDITLTNKEMLENLKDVCEIKDIRERLDLTNLRMDQKKLRKNWLNLSAAEIMNCLLPLFKNIIEEDKKIFESSKKYIIEEMIYQLYSFSIVNDTIRILINENEEARPKTKMAFQAIETKLYAALQDYKLHSENFFGLYRQRDKCMEEIVSPNQIHIFFSAKSKNYNVYSPQDKTPELSKGSRGSRK